MKTTLIRAAWTAEVYRLLCISQGTPKDEKEIKNLYDYAESLGEPEAGYLAEGLTPEQAHAEELSNA